MIRRILPILAAAAACAAPPQGPANLPPPCPADVALAADSSRVQMPQNDRLLIPPQPQRGTAGGRFVVTLVVGTDGRVEPGSVRVAGPENPAYAARLAEWTQQLWFRPATFEGCALRRETTTTIDV